MKISKCCKVPMLETPKGDYCSSTQGGCDKFCEVEDMKSDDISTLFQKDIYEIINKYEEKYQKQINYFEFKNTNHIIGKIKEAKTFEKDIKLIRCHAIMMKDEHGQVIYTFDTIEKADEFFNNLKNNT